MTILAASLDGITVTNVIVLDDMSQAPDGYVECPPWVGIGMDINTPQPTVVDTPADPVAKLKNFLAANPDVAAILG